MNKNNVQPVDSPPYPHPPPGNYPPVQPQPTIVTVMPLGPESARMTCPHCHNEVATVTKKETSTMAYVAGFVLALFGCVCGCCLIPCCMDSCMNTQHYCPHCKAYLGIYKK